MAGKGSGSSGKSRSIDMLNGSIWDKVLIFAVPLALTSMLQQLFNAADIAVIGQFAGKLSMAAVGSNSPIIGLVVNLFVGLSVGANVVIARYTGQKDDAGTERAVHVAITLALISGVCVAVLGNLIAAPMIHLLGVPDSISGLAERYLRIYFSGMPFIMLYNFESAVFRSQGDTRTPLICLSVSGVVNVVLNIFFVAGLGMDVEGVAIATVIANVISSLMMLRVLMKSTGPVRVEFRKLGLEREIAGFMLRVGVPAGLQGIVFSISNLMIQSAVNSVGEDAIAGSSAAFNIEIIGFFIVNSFDQACVSFVSQNYGAQKYARCRKIIRQTMYLSWICSIVSSVLLIAFGHQLLALFNGDPEVIRYGFIRMEYILAAEVINAVIETLSGALRGLGHSLEPALITFVGVCGVRITWVLTVFRSIHTWKMLMIVYPVSWTVTAVILTAVFFRTIRKLPAAGPDEV
jgi:putative MATE family efflux protein